MQRFCWMISHVRIRKVCGRTIVGPTIVNSMHDATTVLPYAVNDTYDPTREIRYCRVQ